MSKSKAPYPTTPDGRYFVVNRKLWRCTNPQLSSEVKTQLVSQLMTARRAVKTALGTGDKEALKTARSQVHQAKVQLGERGPVWWTDDTPDYNRHSVDNSPYSQWFDALDLDDEGRTVPS